MQMFKIIIAGWRHFLDYKLLSGEVEKFITEQTHGREIEIVTGGATGADTLGFKFGALHKLKNTVFPAEWDKYGRSAGPRRNKQMARYANALVAS